MMEQERTGTGLRWVRSDDPEEVTRWARRFGDDHTRAVRGSGPFDYRMAMVEGRTVSVAWGYAALIQTVRGTSADVIVQVPLGAGHEYGSGRRKVAVEPGTFAFTNAGVELVRHAPPGWVMALVIDADRLQSEVAARCGGSAPEWPEYTWTLALGASQQRRFRAQISALARSLIRHQPASVTGRHEQAVVATLAAALCGCSPRRGARGVASRRLAELEAWIDAHLGEPITIGRLCSIAGVGERALQLGFDARRGMSPMRYLLERRLAAVHRRLQADGAEACDVTSVATEYGFTHLGRFSIAYRRSFGESPSSTRRRFQRTASGRAVEGAGRVTVEGARAPGRPGAPGVLTPA